MSAQRELQRLIKRERQKQEGLLHELARIRAELSDVQSQIDRTDAYIQGLEEASKLLPKDGQPSQPAKSTFRPGSDMDKAREALMAARKPMYIADILSAIGKEDTKQNRSSVASSMRTYARKQEVFTMTAPNTFALREWPNQGSGPSQPAEEEYDPFSASTSEDDYDPFS